MKTNRERLKQIMTSSKYGPLSEIFVMTTLRDVAQAHVDAWEKGERWPEDHMINQESWVNVAKEILEILK